MPIYDRFTWCVDPTTVKILDGPIYKESSFPTLPPIPPDESAIWNDISIKQDEMIVHILKSREQIECRGRLENAKRLASQEANVKSKLSYHIVKFEQSIKVSRNVYVHKYRVVHGKV